MKITITINERGTLTLPVKLRKELGFKIEDQLIAETTPEGLLLRPAVTLPLEMYSEERIAEFDREEMELESLLHNKSGPSEG